MQIPETPEQAVAAGTFEADLLDEREQAPEARLWVRAVWFVGILGNTKFYQTPSCLTHTLRYNY